MDSIDQMFTKAIAFDKHDTAMTNEYKHILTGVSIIVMVYYGIRGVQLIQTRSSEVKWFIIGILLAAGWNLIVSMFVDSVMINIPGIYKIYLEWVKEFPSDEDYKKQLSADHFNDKLVMKNFKHLLIIMESLMIFKGLSMGAEKVMKFVRGMESCKSGYSEYKEYNGYNGYNGSNDPTEPDRYHKSISLINMLVKGGGKYLMCLFINTIILSFLIPNNLLMNSTATFYSSDDFQIKFDHLIWAINLLFFSDILTQTLKGVANNPLEPIRPSVIMLWVSILYNGLMIIVTNSLIVLFHDILVNLFFLMVNSILDNLQFEEYNINVFTLVLLNYFTHTSDNSCLHKVCSADDKIEIMVGNFIHFKNLFINCLTVMNLICFVLIPFFMWVLLVEFKLRRVMRDRVGDRV